MLNDSEGSTNKMKYTTYFKNEEKTSKIKNKTKNKNKNPIFPNNHRVAKFQSEIRYLYCFNTKKLKNKINEKNIHRFNGISCI